VPKSISVYHGGNAFGVANTTLTGRIAANAKTMLMVSNVLARIFVFIGLVFLILPLQIAAKKFQEIFDLLHGKSENHCGSACAKATA
jgi:hypothetical protein